MPIRDCEPNRRPITFGAVECFFDALPAVDGAQVDERAGGSGHRDWAEVATILRLEVERLVHRRESSSIAHGSRHGDLDRSRTETVEPVKRGCRPV
jgi:hypothetical protein